MLELYGVGDGEEVWVVGSGLGIPYELNEVAARYRGHHDLEDVEDVIQAVGTPRRRDELVKGQVPRWTERNEVQ